METSAQSAPQDIPVQPSTTAPLYFDEEKRLLLKWSSPSRPFKKRDKDFFTTVTIMAILSIVILFFMREFLVIAVIIALVFLVYVLYTVPPENIDTEVYTTGIKAGNHFYAWPDLLYYWFENRWGNEMMVARTKANLPGAVFILLGPMTREQVEQAIGTRLILRDSADSAWIDRAANWLGKKFPLEKSSTS